jgi:hypothetical protein
MVENLYLHPCKVSFFYLSNFNDSWIFSTEFEKYWDIKFDENPSSGSRVVPWGHTDGRTDMAMLIVTFCNSANTRKKDELYQTITALEMAGVSADCGVVEFARCFAHCRVVTNVCGHLSGVGLVHTAAWGVQLRCEPQRPVISHLPSIAKD